MDKERYHGHLRTEPICALPCADHPSISLLTSIKEERKIQCISTAPVPVFYDTSAACSLCMQYSKGNPLSDISQTSEQCGRTNASLFLIRISLSYDDRQFGSPYMSRASAFLMTKQGYQRVQSVILFLQPPALLKPIRHSDIRLHLFKEPLNSGIVCKRTLQSVQAA